MKRKFALSLAPLKILSKPSGPTSSSARLAHHLSTQSVSDSDEWIQYSPPDSPLIIRRAPLDPKTELELRKACASIHNDSNNPVEKQTEPPLVARSRRLAEEADRQRTEQHTHHSADPSWTASRPSLLTGYSQDAIRDVDRPRSTQRPDLSLRDLFANDLFSNDIIHPTMQTAPTRRPLPRPAAAAIEDAPAAPAPSRAAASRNTLSPPPKQTREPKSMPSTGLSSASTDASQYGNSSEWARSASTTFTSPSVSSMRFSDHVHSGLSAGKGDGAVQERAKPELERPRRQKPSDDFSWRPFDTRQPAPIPSAVLSPQDLRAAQRSSDQTQSSTSTRDPSGPITPGTVPEVISRSGSIASRTSAVSAESPQEQKESTGRWRSWGFRKQSGGMNSKAQVKARHGSRDEGVPTLDFNLNRSLPPLPSLSTYKSEDNVPKEVIISASTPPKSPASTRGQHISSLLRPPPSKAASNEPEVGVATIVNIHRPSESVSTTRSRPADNQSPRSAEFKSKKYFVESGTNVIRSRPSTAGSKQPTSILKSPTSSTFHESLHNYPFLSPEPKPDSDQPLREGPPPSFSRPHTRSKEQRRLTPNVFDFDSLMSAMREGIRTPPPIDEEHLSVPRPVMLDSMTRSQSENTVPTQGRSDFLQPVRAPSALSMSKLMSLTSYGEGTSSTPAVEASAEHSDDDPQPFLRSSSTTTASDASTRYYQYTSTAPPTTSTTKNIHAPNRPTAPLEHSSSGTSSNGHAAYYPAATAPMRPLYSHTSSQYQARGLRKVLSALSSHHSSHTSFGNSKVWIPPPTPHRGEWGGAGRSVTSLDRWGVGVDESGSEYFVAPGTSSAADGTGSVGGRSGGAGGAGTALHEWDMDDEDACAAPVIRF